MQKAVIVGVTSALAGAVGFALGYVYCDRKMLRIYDEAMQDEMEKMRHHYKTLYKGEEFSTPESTARHLNRDVEEELHQHQIEDLEEINEETVKKVARRLQQKVDYTKIPPSKRPPVKKVVVTVKEDHTEGALNIIADDFPGIPVDLPPDDPDGPYVINKDMFFENQSGYKQITLTWFAGDNILMDENDGVVETVAENVGERNLTRFGYLSGDTNVVYIRNERLEVDFEILLSTGHYREIVLGENIQE